MKSVVYLNKHLADAVIGRELMHFCYPVLYPFCHRGSQGAPVSLKRLHTFQASKLYTCSNSFSISAALVTIGPRTAYSIVLMLGLRVSMVRTLVRFGAAPFCMLIAVNDDASLCVTLRTNMMGFLLKDFGFEKAERHSSRWWDLQYAQTHNAATKPISY